MLTRTIYSSICILILVATISYGDRDNSKFLGNQLTEEERHLHKRKRPGYQGSASGPCIGGYGKPKNQPTGRTFFDLQFLSVQNEHNYNLNINCGEGGGGGHYPAHPAPVNEDHGGHKPGGFHKPGGHGDGGGHRPPHRPGKPGGGGGFGNGGFGGFFGGGNNKPQGGPFNPEGGGEGGSYPNPGNMPGGAFASAVAGIFPSPQEFAGGLSDGIQSFIGTIPAIGQSFASILPSFGDFQLPQFQWPQFNPGDNTGPVTFAPLFQGSGSGSFSNPFNRPPAVAAPTVTTPIVVTSAPLTTTTDPDDIIYSDEIKPVNEDYDPITDPYISNKLPPGRNQYKSYIPRGRSLYQDYREESPQYRSKNQHFYQQSRSRSGEGGFRFPS